MLCPVSRIYISSYSCGRGNPSQSFDDLWSADVPRMDDVVGPCELFYRRGAQKTVRIGDYADPHSKCGSQGLTNFRTNSSFGCGGSGVFLSLGSLGLRRKFPTSNSLNPAASTSCRRNTSSIRCRVPDSEMPVPGRPE